MTSQADACAASSLPGLVLLAVLSSSILEPIAFHLNTSAGIPRVPPELPFLATPFLGDHISSLMFGYPLPWFPSLYFQPRRPL